MASGKQMNGRLSILYPFFCNVRWSRESITSELHVFFSSSESNRNADDKQGTKRNMSVCVCVCTFFVQLFFANRLVYLRTLFNTQSFCVCKCTLMFLFVLLFFFSFESSDLALTFWLIIFHLYWCCYACCNFVFVCWCYCCNWGGLFLAWLRITVYSLQWLRCHMFAFALVLEHNFQLISVVTDDRFLTNITYTFDFEMDTGRPVFVRYQCTHIQFFTCLSNAFIISFWRCVFFTLFVIQKHFISQ